MIVGTAGHIDHGKTSLVKALTGVDADRLAEEKRRGITIDLGYAYCESASGTVLGFVDVPGHEKFVHNMLAGATGIDHALLVIAADDGIMPQTREHLAVLQLLGMRSGVLVITKIDRVDQARLLELEQQLVSLTAGTFLADALIFRVSNLSGAGIAELKEYLNVLSAGADSARQAGSEAATPTQGMLQIREGFRLAIDRVFTLVGVGTVATGTVHAGEVSVGDTVRLAPRGLDLKVRGLHAQNRRATQARRGDRCALNLTGDGLERSMVQRGAWLTAPWLQRASSRFDVRIQALAELRSPLAAWMPAHLHLGTADVMCRILPLSSVQIEAGQQAWAQLVCDCEIHICTGDRFVLRNQGANLTLAGGVVVDPLAPQRRRRTPQRMSHLQGLALADVAERLLSAVRLAGTEVALAPLAAQWNVDERTLTLLAQAQAEFVCKVQARSPQASPGSSAPVTNDSPAKSVAPLDLLRPGDHWIVWHRDLWTQLCRRVLDTLGEFHQQFNDELGCERDRLRRMAVPEMERGAARLLIQWLIDQGEILASGVWLHREDHRVQLSEAESRFRVRVLTILEEANLEPPWVRELARLISLEEVTVRAYLLRLVRNGEVHQVVRDLFFSRKAFDRLIGCARGLQFLEGKVSAARFRDESRLSRKRAVQVLEYFDRVGITRRVRDVHYVREQHLI